MYTEHENVHTRSTVQSSRSVFLLRDFDNDKTKTKGAQRVYYCELNNGDVKRKCREIESECMEENCYTFEEHKCFSSVDFK